ncbi:hypothetical protein RhiirA1_475464 [Rhizophagus irregularis]|uniref:Endonuclease/exonuclease/phosphatase domain-containing protein n=1 Tax=Rhizophagus irregularis TaxID=588596 RepID=A0A2N0QWT6_9GLOM|nr:hypothetical protein RhiirA1_475464 [Rhizophagus irregularis]
MTTPKAPSVINPDILPPPPPEPTIPPGNCSLSPDNSGRASAKRSLAVITQPPIINTNSLDSSIHARSLPASTTVASHDDKGKSIAFAIPERQPSSDVTQFNDIWAIICLGNSLRVCPASFSKSQRDSRREHVAILAGISKNIKEADLLEIASQVNAKTLNVPLFISSNPIADQKIANTLNTLDETVSWMQDTITLHKYRLSELESMMGYDTPEDSDLYPSREENEYHSYNNEWDDKSAYNTNSQSNLSPHTSSSLMDTFPDAFFSTLDPSSVLSSRHVPLPTFQPNIIALMLLLPVCNWKFLMLLVYIRIFLPNLVRLWKNWTSSLSQTLPLLMIEHQVILGASQRFHPPPVQINVNDLCSPIRQLHLLNYFLHSSFGSYWASSPSNSRPHDGVGLLLRHPLHKHVQKIDPWKGRLLKLDLFFHQTKISIISVYIPPYHSIHYKERDAIFAQLNLWLDKARSNNYHVVILGDFNADEISHSHLPQHHLKILRSLSSRYFMDHQSHISSISGPSPTFYYQNGSSRLDYIWSSPGFPAPGLFSHIETCPKLNNNQFTDHHILIMAFDFKDTWDTFSNEVNSRLELYLATHHPSISSLLALPLDKLWHALKRSILGGAIVSLPFQHVSNTYHYKYPSELTMLIAINKFLDRLLFKLTTSRPGRPAQISQMINSLPTQLTLLKSLLIDYTIPIYSTIPLPVFVKFLHSQKALVSAYLFTQFQ